MKKHKRTLKELLEVVLNNYEKSKISYVGLCTFIDYLHEKDLITISEVDTINHFIWKELDTGKYYRNTLLFKTFHKEPRIEWLKRQIQLNELENKCQE
jgi:hypothetical protein